MTSLSNLLYKCRTLLIILVFSALTGCLSTPDKPGTTEPDLVSGDNQITVTKEKTRSIEKLSDYAQSGLMIVDPQFKQSYRKALSAIEKNKLQQAATQLDQLMISRPDLIGPIYNRALLAKALKDDGTAQQLLEKAHGINPFDVRVCSLLGKQLREQGKFKEAQNLYLSCISDEKQSAVIHKNYGILLDLYLHQPELALKHYQQYQELTGNTDKRVKGWVRDLQRRMKQKAVQ